MISDAKFEEIKASGHLPSPKGVAMQVIELTRGDEVTNQGIAHEIKADPALSGRIIKVANAHLAYQTRPVTSIVNAVSVLGLNAVRQLVLSLSIIDDNRKGACPHFDYQKFWAHSLLTAITAQNLVLYSGIGSTEEVFILGLLGQIGSLSLATAHPQEYGRILNVVATKGEAELVKLERSEFDFDHNHLTQAMLADWGMPRVFQEVALHHEDPEQSGFVIGGRDWRLLNVLYIANLFAGVCSAEEPYRRKLMPRMILNATRLGIEMDALAKIYDKSVSEWHEWSTLCGLHSVAFPPFSQLLEAVPLEPGMQGLDGELSVESGTVYKMRILLVDDDRSILLLLDKLLSSAGHSVVTARNGVEALAKIEEFMPQLIITDWVMPEMDGISFCKAVRQNASWRNIYMFIMTVQEGSDKLVEAFEAGANDYMVKPINPKLLMARIRAGQRVVQLQEEMEFDREQLHEFANELAVFNVRLRRSDVRLRAILDNSPYMTWLKDAEGCYVKVNKMYVDYLQQTGSEQIIGKTDFDFLPKKLAEKYLRFDTEVMAQRQQKDIEESFLDGGKIRWIQTFRTPVIDENGKVLGMTGFARDITERKVTEADLRIAATAFEAQDGMMIQVL